MNVGGLGLEGIQAAVGHITWPPLARFAVTALLVLLVPLLARRLRLPDCVGYILGGVLIGPYVLGIVPQHGEVAEFFAEIGKLLLMFFVGMEIDVRQFVAQRRRALAFGLVTFAIPLVVGTLTGLGFGYALLSAILIGSLLSSHTLIAFPIIVSSGLSGRAAVTATVGATVLTDILALLVLAGCLATHRSGFDLWALLWQVAELVIFAALLIFGLGRFGRHLVRYFGRVEEGIIVLMIVIVVMAALGAEAINLEGIIGAFLAGLAVNEAVGDDPGKAKLEAMGNTLFIPAFFIVTGLIIDPHVLVASLTQDLPLVLAVTLAVVISKWAAAEIMGRRWGLEPADRGLMASLTMPQVAATLAAALVGYEAVNAAGQRLIDERMLNTLLVVVVVTAVLGPVFTGRFARRLSRRTVQAPVAGQTSTP